MNSECRSRETLRQVQFYIFCGRNKYKFHININQQISKGAFILSMQFQKAGLKVNLGLSKGIPFLEIRNSATRYSILVKFWETFCVILFYFFSKSEHTQTSCFLDKIIIDSVFGGSENWRHMGFFLLNPIPTGHGRNQPIYERHVTKSGRNRVKLV